MVNSVIEELDRRAKADEAAQAEEEIRRILAEKATASEPQQFTALPVHPPPAPTQSEDIQALIKMVNDLKEQVAEVTQPQRNQFGRDITNRNPAISKRYYCWTHGNCNHPSNECTRKAKKHKDEATYTNMMGGSKRGCYWLPGQSS